MSKRAVNYLTGALSLLLGFLLYLIFRGNTYISSMFAKMPFLEETRRFFQWAECGFLKYYFPDYLWGLSLGCWLQGLFDPDAKGTVMCAVATFACGTVWELLQWIGAVSGTADALDVLMYLLAGLTCLIINIKEKRKV